MRSPFWWPMAEPPMPTEPPARWFERALELTWGRPLTSVERLVVFGDVPIDPAADLVYLSAVRNG